MSNELDIKRVDFFSESKNLKLKLDKFDITFRLHRVSTDQYMEMKAMYMMWFYMYYMDAPRDQNNRPSLYPVYRIEINRTEYADICQKIMNKLLHSAIRDLKNNDDVDESMSEELDLAEGDILSTITENDEEEEIENIENDPRPFDVGRGTAKPCDLKLPYQLKNKSLN